MVAHCSTASRCDTASKSQDPNPTLDALCSMSRVSFSCVHNNQSCTLAQFGGLHVYNFKHQASILANNYFQFNRREKFSVISYPRIQDLKQAMSLLRYLSWFVVRVSWSPSVIIAASWVKGEGYGDNGEQKSLGCKDRVDKV
jgi:hypothetical protein